LRGRQRQDREAFGNSGLQPSDEPRHHRAILVYDRPEQSISLAAIGHLKDGPQIGGDRGVEFLSGDVAGGVLEQVELTPLPGKQAVRA
jgi:hypothetical protein